MFSGIIQVVPCTVLYSSLCLNNLLHGFLLLFFLFCVFYHHLFIHSSVDWHLSPVHLLKVVNIPVMIIYEQLLIWVPTFISLGVFTYERIGRSDASLFQDPLGFHNSCTIFNSHQQCMRVPMSLYSLQTLWFSSYFFFHCSSHPHRFEVVSPCNFDLHFLNDHWFWASFHVTIGYL